MRLDRRVIYLLAGILVVFPLVKPFGLPLAVSKQVEDAFKVIDAIPNGSTVLVGFDYEPGSVAELHPQAKAVLSTLARKNIKVVGLTSFPVSTKFAEDTFAATYAAAGKVYGTDYVNLGYYAGAESSFAAFCENPTSVFKNEYHGQAVSSLPIMAGIKNAGDFNMVITFNDGPGTGTNPEMYVRQVNISYGKKLVVGVTGVMGPANMSFLNSGNISGLMVGLKAAAKLEKLSQAPGAATAAMDALSLAHILVVVMIALGNVAMYFEKRRPSQKSGGVA